MSGEPGHRPVALRHSSLVPELYVLSTDSSKSRAGRAPGAFEKNPILVPCNNSPSQLEKQHELLMTLRNGSGARGRKRLPLSP